MLTTRLVPRLPGASVTLYTSPNLYAHLSLQSAGRVSLESPKSSFTPPVPSLVLLPRNSHRTLRAKPCCGSLLPAGGGPKTGKTSGMPPRTGLEPSRTAAEERKRFSRGPEAEGVFHEVTVAPWRRISTASPEGSEAETDELVWEVCAWDSGAPGVEARAAGRLGRSIFFGWRGGAWLS